MVQFIKGSDLKNIKVKFMIIYFFNVLDIMFTLFLLKTGMFEEGNIIMQPIVKNSFSAIFIKIILPLVLLIVLYCRIKKATLLQLKYSNIIILFLTFLYLIICSFHVIFSFLYFLYSYVI
ncbi:DUF5658 family protein [Clostridium sp. 19966]|uniref:DUF5658 family protein n=1 Tax=Clostridium sp. 19966 TaxID=2768166 RepID=UPI0028E5B56F|nr:DUF5658 family protein [Clostridium sp. 19966]